MQGGKSKTTGSVDFQALDVKFNFIHDALLSIERRLACQDWLIERQNLGSCEHSVKEENPQINVALNGRPGKKSDTCYTWWTLSS